MPEETETKKSLWRRYLEVSLIWKMAVALVVGVVAGLIFGEDIAVVQPLGANMNMDGTAIYVGAATVFVANVDGMELSMAQIATIALVGVLASIGTAGVPGAGMIMVTMSVTAPGLPMAPVALIAGIDALLDMGRTMVNVTGDLTCTRVVAKTEPGMLDDGDSDSDSPPPERPAAVS